MRQPTLTALAASLPAVVPFVGLEMIERRRGRAFRARIGANELVLGPSPRAVEAMARVAAEANFYCDLEHYALREALGARFGIGMEHVAIGGGIDGLLGQIVRLFMEPGATVVTSLGAYPTFNYHVTGFGGRLVTVPYRDDHEDIGALIDTARAERASIVYLANPDNPMGTWASAEAVTAMIEAVPDDTLFILDEAYFEFAPEGTVPPLADHLERHNLIRLRTFSKAYGMAGQRVGYAIARPDIAAAFDRVRDHFGVSRVAQAGALAALGDAEHLSLVLSENAKGRARIEAIARDNGLASIPSATNFVAIDCGRDGAFAQRVLDALIERDVFIRKSVAPGLDRCIRASVSIDSHLDIFAEELPGALSDAARA